MGISFLVSFAFSFSLSSAICTWLLLLLLLSCFSHVRLCETPKMAAHQAPPSMGFSRQSTGVGCHCLLRLFIIGDWNAVNVGSQEVPGVTGKFGLGVQNEADQSLTEFWQENTLVIANTLFQQHKRRLYTWTSPNGQH